MRRSQQTALDFLFVVTEVIPWFAAVRLAATATERSFLRDVADRLQGEVATVDARQTLLDVREASESVVSGPSLLLVLVAALGAFALMRWMQRARLGGALGAVTLLLASIVALNVLLHLALAGDLQLWDNSGVARFADEPASYFAERFDLQAFLADPALDRPHGAALSLTFMGMVVVWLRFLVAGRTPVTMERALRSFSLGFAAMLLVLVGARAGDVGSLAWYAVLYFVLGVLLLAVGNNTRAQQPTEGVRRTAPWVLSVAGTVALLAVSAMVLGLLAYLDAGRVAAYLANIVGRILGVILIVIITPIFWVVDTVLRFLLPEGMQGIFDNFAPFEPGEQPPEEATGEEDGGLPGWVVDSLKALALAALFYGSYRLARVLLARRQRDEGGEYGEVRAKGGEGAGVGQLLRNLFPRGGRGSGMPDWTRAHQVYRLFARIVRVSDDRGFRRQAGETPLEFAAAGARVLEAPVFTEIAAEFDRARYGRHFPDAARLEPLARALAEWEQAHPATEEMRTRLAGARQPSEVEELGLRIEQAKRAARSTRATAQERPPPRRVNF
ncbi:MAG: DUF4129 domain-containing protein [Dehalococcoidia bacterium]|nr:DUF4129 domain-containing protein [Dehalococcoidia bacterium]